MIFGEKILIQSALAIFVYLKGNFVVKGNKDANTYKLH